MSAKDAAHGPPASGLHLEVLDYELPDDRIAQHPAPRREDARLLVVERAGGALHDARFSDLGDWLRPGDALALNETRVRPARIEALRLPGGGRVELLFVRPEPAASVPTPGFAPEAQDASPGPDAAAPALWRVLARPARRAAPGARLESADGSLALEVVGAGELGERVVRVVAGDLEATLAREGKVPLPPYVKRAPTEADRERYQTVFARVEGAVAAPTAGLHFSASMIERLERGGIAVARLLLHVGPGTFRPITTADPREHRMDEEYFEVSAEAAETLRSARAAGGRVVAVGTTAVRALESACDANGGALGPARGWTRKYIYPPYRFRAVDAMITNFHLPRTTLLLLVAAFAGEERTIRAYRHAVAERYRFYSYGDAMLVV